MAAVDRNRQAVLKRLVITDVAADSAALLQEFVCSGSKEEAVLATRALCGYGCGSPARRRRPKRLLGPTGLSPAPEL